MESLYQNPVETCAEQVTEEMMRTSTIHQSTEQLKNSSSARAPAKKGVCGIRWRRRSCSAALTISAFILCSAGVFNASKFVDVPFCTKLAVTEQFPDLHAVQVI
jgi:hypothetical protein